jgi:hypothetical protein
VVSSLIPSVSFRTTGTRRQGWMGFASARVADPAGRR